MSLKDGILFLPLLHKISKKINFIELNFNNFNNELCTYQIKDNKILIKQKKNVLNLENGVIIIMDQNKISDNDFDNDEIISENEIQKNLSHSLMPQVNVWNKISKIANKTFVPESEESRNKGAGGGDAND